MPYSAGTGSGGNIGSVQSIGRTAGNRPPSATQDLIQQALQSVYPQLASGYLSEQGLQQQIGLIDPSLQSQLAYNQAMSGYQGQNLALSEQALGIQQTGLQQQGAQAQAQQGFEQQQYGLQAGQYPEQQAEAALAYQNALMQTQGSQAISGTQNTVGGRAAVNTLGQQYGFQQQDIARNQALSQLGQQSELSGYGYQQQQLQNAAKNLQLNAQANGISQQQLLTMLNYGQQQAGLGAQQSAISLYGQLGQAQLGNFATAAGALSNIGFKGAGVNTIAGTGG
jgi:hypothetical protein